MSIVIGIDLSLQRTGAAIIRSGTAETFTIPSKPEQDWRAFPERVDTIIARVVSLIPPGARSTVVIESPAYGAKGNALDRMFGGWWLAIDRLRHIADTIYKAAPSQVKRYATGNGNAGKDEVLSATIRLYPESEHRTNDEADALVLAAIGAAIIGEPYGRPLTAQQKQIVADIRDGKTRKK